MTAEWDLREAYAYYRDGRTLRDVGERYGVASQTVHKRFVRAGLARCNNKKWVREEVDVLIAAYRVAGDGPVDLDALSQRLERHKTNICRKARELGLTDQGRPHSPEANAQGGATRQLVNAMRLTPLRPALGLRHTEESKRRIGEGSRQAWRDPSRKARATGAERRRDLSERMSQRLREGGNVYSHARRGRRPDLGDTFFRSAWEANYARYLDLLVRRRFITAWAYEPDTFWFERIRRGVRSYTPDFRVDRSDGSCYYVEVKGWMDAKSKTKLKRMAKYHPTVELRVVGAKEYREIERKLAGAIPNWESGAARSGAATRSR